MKKIVLKGRKITGGVAEGEALVSPKPVSFCGGLDPYTGTLTERNHPLMNANIKDKVLVFTTGKGSSYFSHAAHASRVSGTAPKAMIVRENTALTALASVVMHIPAVTDLNHDPIESIATGDWVKVDGDKGVVEITKKA